MVDFFKIVFDKGPNPFKKEPAGTKNLFECALKSEFVTSVSPYSEGTATVGEDGEFLVILDNPGFDDLNPQLKSILVDGLGISPDTRKIRAIEAKPL